MKTLLSVFCEEFDGSVRPLLAPLTKAADTLNQVSDKGPLRALLPTVLDVRHHLSTLADKVAEQQAYVLIFGPLKSGKSTLMNAISAAYVSEVTTLPAYPCMVYVSHAEEVSFEVTRYTGESEEFRDMDSMRTLMEWAHNELADRLREVEARGEEFEPSTHAPQAIRRIDVRLPANHLESSSAVLVDTPGLYSRMKFGYDKMTREFRNTASCAIFVVKTDNLFLEQVFEEFSQLLDLFSRIFLVVNIDSTKRDLFPDGELGPSLETSDPERIITAFQNLSMSGPLKQAVEDGRLKIYPVDLLRAASRRLQATPETDAEEPVGLAGFHNFLTDLTDYLNSTDYMVAFLGDSLRQARGLMGEIATACERPEVRELDEMLTKLRAEAEQLAGVDHAITRLQACGWETCFEALGEDLTAIAAGRIEKLRESCESECDTALASWFEGDGSFQDLVDEALRPLLARARRDLAETARGVLDTVAGTHTAGATLADQLKQDLETVNFDLGSLGRAALVQLEPAQGLAGARLRISTEAVPVRKGFFDYLLFRGRSSVRARLFGPHSSPTKPIPAGTKARRLGSAGQDALGNAIDTAFENFFDQALDHLSTRVLEMYIESLRKAIQGGLKKARESHNLRRSAVDRRVDELSRVVSSLSELRSSVAISEAGLVSLAARYGHADPSLLDQIVSEDELTALEAAAEAGGDVTTDVEASEAVAATDDGSEPLDGEELPAPLTSEGELG